MLNVLFVLFMIAIGIGIVVFGVKTYNKSCGDFLEVVGISEMILGGAAIGIFAIIFCCQLFELGSVQINKEADRAVFQQRYNSIIYQLNSGIYDGDDGKGNTDVGNMARRELYSDIEWWNKDLAERKAKSVNPWTNIFYPKDLYDDFDFIEYPEMAG